jgi:hypothetical protein
MLRNGIPRDCFYFFPRTRIPSCSLFPGTGIVRNRIPSVFRVVSSTEWFRKEFREFASIFVPRTEFWAFFSSAEWFGTEFQEFSVLWNSWNSARTSQLFCLFHLSRNKFFVGNCQSYLPIWLLRLVGFADYNVLLKLPRQNEPSSHWGNWSRVKTH